MRINPIATHSRKPNFGVYYVDNNDKWDKMELELEDMKKYYDGFMSLRKEIEEHPKLKDVNVPYELRIMYNDDVGSYISPQINKTTCILGSIDVYALHKPKARKATINELIKTAEFLKLI